MNQQYMFYNEYYRGISRYSQVNDKITTGGIYEQTDEAIPLCDQSFILKTLYPGLLAGTGYAHEGGDVNDADKNDEIKLGFSFDYVTGLPYIPGSSLKGLLKSCFCRYEAFIATMLDCPPEVVRELKKRIFENDENNGQDVFLDCYPVHPDDSGHVLGMDYITSHRAKDPAYDGLIDPVPLKMLRILPDVSMLFRFILKDTTVSVNDQMYRLLAKNKLILFQELLCTFGAGAKTNVGYGRFVFPERMSEIIKWLSVRNSAGKEVKTEAVAQRNGKERSRVMSNSNICPRCHTNELKMNPTTSRFYPICSKCKKEAPTCSKCGNKPVNWNIRSNCWFDTCTECHKKINDRKLL